MLGYRSSEPSPIKLLKVAKRQNRQFFSIFSPITDVRMSQKIMGHFNKQSKIKNYRLGDNDTLQSVFTTPGVTASASACLLCHAKLSCTTLNWNQRVELNERPWSCQVVNPPKTQGLIFWVFHRVARGWWGVARNWRFAWPSQWRLCSGKRTQSNRFPLLSPKMTTFCACPVSKVNHRHIVDALGSVDTPQPTHPHPPRYYLIIAGCQ